MMKPYASRFGPGGFGGVGNGSACIVAVSRVEGVDGGGGASLRYEAVEFTIVGLQC